MSYTIEYGNMPEAEARAKALEDIEFFLGTERLAKIHEIFVGEFTGRAVERRRATVRLRDGRVRGVPARVWLDEIRKCVEGGV